MREVKKERTGKRDLALSERHRLYGFDCPATDIDFLLIEYSYGKCVALIEHKHENAPPQFASHPTYRALIDLGDKASLPVFFVRYVDNFSKFTVVPLNSFAKKFEPEKKIMDEGSYVALLYRLRNISDVPKEILDGLTDERQF